MSTWTTAEVARMTGVTSRTLRHYDAEVLVRPVGVGGGGVRLHGRDHLHVVACTHLQRTDEPGRQLVLVAAHPFEQPVREVALCSSTPYLLVMRPRRTSLRGWR